MLHLSYSLSTLVYYHINIPLSRPLSLPETLDYHLLVYVGLVIIVGVIKPVIITGLSQHLSLFSNYLPCILDSTLYAF